MKLNLVGGFLGSGKTTAITNACRVLMEQKKVVAVITNDQGAQQVDSAAVATLNVPTREVADGCFCCQFDELDSHLHALEADHHPDVIFAESVGTCTDLIATIVKPLGLQRPGVGVVISVFAEAPLLASLLEGTSLFIEESVRYIYKKQLEEADLLIINKADLVSQYQLRSIKDVINTDHPHKKVLYQNSNKRSDIARWMHEAERFQTLSRVSLDLDYTLYGSGEACLGWLDKRIDVSAGNGRALHITHKIIDGIFRRIQEHRLTAGHLKFFIETKDWSQKVSFTTSNNDFHLLPGTGDIRDVHILINARVQTNPQILQHIVDEVIQNASETGCDIIDGQWSAFTPGFPKPTHRVSNGP